MRLPMKASLVLVVLTSLVAGACSSAATTAPATGVTGSAPAANALPPAGGWPWTGKLADGSTFTLAPSIAAKVRAHQPVNYMMSYQGPGVPLFSQQYQAGYANSLPQAQAIYPMNGVLEGPVSASGIDPAGQIAQIEALYNTGKLDCLSVEPIETSSFTKEDNKLLAAGIPVFTVGITSADNALTNFTQVPMKEGAQAANIVLQWMKANNEQLKVFAVTSGDPGSTWGHGRSQSFYDTIKAAIPDATFVDTPSNEVTLPYDPTQAYNAAKALILGHPDLQFIMNSDIDAEYIDRAIKDTGNTGKIFTIGWNLSFAQLDNIDSGTQVAALDQRWDQQAGFGALACANFFAKGVVLPNSQTLNPVTKGNTAAARAELTSILGTPPPSTPAPTQ